MTLTTDWGWVPDVEKKSKSAAKVIATLAEVVAKGGSLLLGVGPTPQGFIEDHSVRTLHEIGLWTRANGEAIYSTIPTEVYTNDDRTVWFTANKDGKTLYAIIPKQDGKPLPSSISWKGNTPRRGTKMQLLSNGKSLKWKTINGTTTVFLPRTSENGVAVKFSTQNSQKLSFLVVK